MLIRTGVSSNCQGGSSGITGGMNGELSSICFRKLAGKIPGRHSGNRKGGALFGGRHPYRQNEKVDPIRIGGDNGHCRRKKSKKVFRVQGQSDTLHIPPFSMSNPFLTARFDDRFPRYRAGGFPTDPCCFRDVGGSHVPEGSRQDCPGS